MFVVVALAIVVLALLGRLANDRRTASVPADITSARFQAGGGKEMRRTGYHTAYVYRVRSETYTGRAFVTWRDPASSPANVCYDPGNPRDHLLVEPGTTCPPR